MTVPTTGTWAPLNTIPQTQNTAPVQEFRCLYTSDLRRKQKRWQDGRLKYHTFNKRIMVYDDRSNFVGDSHWREDHTFGEGKEVELERCGILVEVSECMGTREQDLTPLLNKVLKDRQERAHARVFASSLPRPRGPVLRTERVGQSHVETTERSSKRRKPNNCSPFKNAYAQNLSGATLALSGAPSTAASLRFDLGCLRTIRQPVEEIDMSTTPGLNQSPQERPIAIRISQTQVHNGQPKSIPNKSSSETVDSGYARNITAADLVLASKTLTGRRLPPRPGLSKKAISRSGETSAQAITIEDDEFVDIDVYDKENLQAEKATTASFLVTERGKSHQKKSSPDLLSCYPRSEGVRPERPFNPLRIKIRPRRKLLSTAVPPSRPPSFNEPRIENGKDPTSPPASSKIGRETQLPVVLSQATSVTETKPFNIEEHCSSSLVNIEMDHHGIDALLARKLLGQTRVDEELYTNVHFCTETSITTQSAEESNNMVGSDGQEGTLSSLIPAPQLGPKQKNVRNSRQLSMLRGNTESKIDKARIGAPKSFSASLRLMKPLVEGAQANELRGITVLTSAEDSKISRTTYQAGRVLPMNRDVILFKPPLKVTGATTQGTNVAQRDYKQGGYEEHAMPPMIANTGSAVHISKAKAAREDAIPGGDQGPWSREAFDLFDWRPGAATTGDSLATG